MDVDADAQLGQLLDDLQDFYRGTAQAGDFAHQYFLNGALATQRQQLLNPLSLLILASPTNLLGNLGHDLYCLAPGHGAQVFHLPLVLLLFGDAHENDGLLHTAKLPGVYQVNHLVFLIRIHSAAKCEKTVIAALRIPKIGPTLKLIQFCQSLVDLPLVEVLRPIGPEPGRPVVLPDILAGQ